MPVPAKRPAVDIETVDIGSIENLINHAAQKFQETMAIAAVKDRLFFPHGITLFEVGVTIEKVAAVTIKVSGPDSAKPAAVTPAASV